MYLSRIQLNPARRDAQQLLASPHALHAAVQAAFPDPAPRPEGRVLWRLDVAQHATHVYIVSPTRPDSTHIAEQAGWPSLDDTQLVRPYSPLLSRIEKGQRYAFRLTANPTHTTRSVEGERGKVFGHVTVAQQERWLLDRQEHAGFLVDMLAAPHAERSEETEVARALVIKDRRTLSFSRRETRVTLRIATYEGSLQVIDRDAFVSALCHGIGRAKGYGCGLMTIAPA
ncbi:type I-E CRISPR-associated protein Cas6/Cse3/CasE [Microbacterium sp.]|uniref:type I-E CRISPR-associated protein Cas6/Cse3/CasE n=1 Tax=Microbacterium sp. TaxID=51671 RepID=UPI0039E6B82A